MDPAGLPEPGEVFRKDYRSQDTVELLRKRKEGSSSTQRENTETTEAPETLRIVTWNIERGYKLRGIVDELGRLDADIVCLQEVDAYCRRTKHVDVGDAIARELQYNYLFAAGNRTSCGGVGGTAILTKFDLQQEHTVFHPRLTWDHWTEKLDNWVRRKIGTEPLTVDRVAAAAEISVPGVGDILCYSDHLECHCGPLGRLQQMSEVMADVLQYSHPGQHQLICGDMNTLVKGINRISTERYDRLTAATWGVSESELWGHHIFHPEPDLTIKGGKLRDVRKTHMEHFVEGFRDPFDVKKHPTLEFRLWNRLPPVFTAKLDWMLMRGGFNCTERQLGGDTHSDHKWLCADTTIAQACPAL